MTGEPVHSDSLNTMQRLRYLPVAGMAIIGLAVSLVLFVVMQRWERRQIQADLTVAGTQEQRLFTPNWTWPRTRWTPSTIFLAYAAT